MADNRSTILRGACDEADPPLNWKQIFQMKAWTYYGLYVPNMLWRSMEIFLTNALCLNLASEHYSKNDYLRDYDEFLKLANHA